MRMKSLNARQQCFAGLARAVRAVVVPSLLALALLVITQKSTRPPRRRSTFSYTVPSESRAARSFVAAGSGEAREGGPSHSSEAMREKASFVLGAMEQRMAALGFSWADVTATQVYTIFAMRGGSSGPATEIHPLLADEFVRRGAMSCGLTWHFARPPLQGLDFEVDVRGVDHE